MRTKGVDAVTACFINDESLIVIQRGCKGKLLKLRITAGAQWYLSFPVKIKCLCSLNRFAMLKTLPLGVVVYLRFSRNNGVGTAEIIFVFLL